MDLLQYHHQIPLETMDLDERLIFVSKSSSASSMGAFSAMTEAPSTAASLYLLRLLLHHHLWKNPALYVAWVFWKTCGARQWVSLNNRIAKVPSTGIVQVCD